MGKYRGKNGASKSERLENQGHEDESYKTSFSRNARPKQRLEGPTIGEQIGPPLRDLYSDVVSEPVPKRFLELLNRLKVDKN